MRKKTVNHLADTIFWYALYFLPVLAYLIFVFSAPFAQKGSNGNIPVNVEYHEQYYATIQKGSTVSLAMPSIAPNVKKDYYALTIAGYYNDDLGERVAFKYPVIVCKESYDGVKFSSGTPVMRITDDMASLASDFTFPVPTNSFSGSFTLWNCTAVANQSWGNIPMGSNPPVLYAVKYIIDERPLEELTYNFEDFVREVGFGFASENVIVNTLFGLFGRTGFFPLFNTRAPFIIFGWFIGVYLGHLAVDFLLFIPRWAHKFIKDFTE